MALVLLAEFNSLPEAHIAASVLESAGVDAVVMDGADMALNPIAQLKLGYRVMVLEEDLFTARQVLTEALKAGDEADEA